MDRTRLTALLEEPGRIAAQDLGALRELTERHPWFSGAHVLLANGESMLGDVMRSEHLRDAAAHVPVREVLYQADKHPPVAEAPVLTVVRDEPTDALSTEETEDIVEEVISQRPAPPPPPQLSDTEIAERILEQQMLEAAIATSYDLQAMVVEPPSEEPASVPSSEASSEGGAAPAASAVEPPVSAPPPAQGRLSFTAWLELPQVVESAIPAPTVEPAPSTLQQRIQAAVEYSNNAPPEPPKTLAPTPTAQATRSAIDRFLHKTPLEPPKKAEFFSPQEAGRRSLKDQAGLVSETLARIYEQQGNYAKAAEAYRKLALKVPEKAAYFAALSQAAAEKLKKEG